MKIAIFISGIIKKEDEVIRCIDSIKEQFSFCEVCHIYFQTWTDTCSEDILKIIRNKVYRVVLNEMPPKLTSKEYLEMQDVKKSDNVFCMLTGISNLCNEIDKNYYDFICRCRNDLFIEDDFSEWLEVLKSNECDYICPLALWVFDDCCNDHFCIAKPDVFFRVWNFSQYELKLIFMFIKLCPEKLLLTRIRFYKIKAYFTIPKNYILYNNIIENYNIKIESLNEYMKKFIIIKLRKISQIKSKFIKFN